MKITYEEVIAAAQELDGKGIKPTTIKIREMLGRGSYSTITKHLEEWKPQTEMEAVPPMPEALSELIPMIWGACYKEAETFFSLELHNLRQELEDTKLSLQSAVNAVDQLEADKEKLTDDNEGLSSINMELRDTVADLKTQNGQLNGQITGLREAIASLQNKTYTQSDLPPPILQTTPCFKDRSKKTASKPPATPANTEVPEQNQGAAP